ncbi:DUF3012 domain-containing protein [Denitrobaculum tricleocarpae]|uniref:DUF3012 domain-containing protein n=1 Tax=Denitrobaculum tricleocarpae TaxID=2591009 RepID=A0A545U2Y6_9PROT|nr:DUF3012 domain-containing protein [Denitrobaculum tricleocarpae]TQV83842.1 DUF3012 domain-containing protein [Denitrobaculum tricleocarpae]
MRSLKLVLFAAAMALSPAGTQALEASAHREVVSKAFDNFEAIMFAPLKVDQRTPVAGVRAICQSVQESLNQLVANAERRESLELPDTLEEAQALNNFLATRFRALQTRMTQSSDRIQASGKIIETHCPELSVQQNLAQTAMQIALAQYTPEGWCRAMSQKPEADWSAQDNTYFMRFCKTGNSN